MLPNRGPSAADSHRSQRSDPPPARGWLRPPRAPTRRSCASAPTPRTANVRPRCGLPLGLAGEWAESRSSVGIYAFAESFVDDHCATDCAADDVVELVLTGNRF